MSPATSLLIFFIAADFFETALSKARGPNASALIFSSLAGFDIRESVKIWERMAEEKKGNEPPEWMSTHPSSKTRIENLKRWIPEITVNYPPIKFV